MKISAINIKNNYFINQAYVKDAEKKNLVNVEKTSKFVSYPSNYYVSFGVKGVDAAFSEFKDTEMPTTMRNFIENQQYVLSESEFAKLKEQGLKKLQRIAFADLQDCKTIQDIQAKFPYEEHFKSLKSLSQIKTKSEFFSHMQELEARGIKTLTCEEDVTTFLVKQIYGKADSYKTVIQALSDVITPEAEKMGLKDTLNSYTEARRTFFLPLGINAPNGQTYGCELRNSDTESLKIGNRYFVDLSSEEVNERIQLLLSKTEKSKYSMIDAWNHCEKIRFDLSRFMIENYNNPKYNIQTQQPDVYDVKFYSKMSALMKDFWNNFPEHKETLGKEIKVALERFDNYKNIGGEDFENYKKQVQERSDKIRADIKFKNFDIKLCYPNAFQLLNKIASLANPLSINSEASKQDFAKLLLSSTSVSEFEVLEGDPNSEKYRQLFPNGIKTKMRKLLESSEYKNLENSANFSILNKLVADKIIAANDIEKILKSNDSIDVSIKNLLKSLPKGYEVQTEATFKKYDEYKTHMDGETTKNVRNELLKYNPEFEQGLKLDILLSTQGNYLKNVLSDNPLKELTQLAFWQEFDRINGTSYLPKVNSNIQQSDLIDYAISIVDELDFSQGSLSDW